MFFKWIQWQIETEADEYLKFNLYVRIEGMFAKEPICPDN